MKKNTYNWLTTIYLFLVVSIITAKAELLPIKHLTTADGLPQNNINSIKEDSKGFFWVATFGGLSRYDGYEFVNFTTEQGLPASEIYDILIDSEKVFWLATKRGLVKFNLEGNLSDGTQKISHNPAFTSFPIVEGKETIVTKLVKDSNGIIWFGTNRGLFYFDSKIDKPDFQKFDLELPTDANNYVYMLNSDKRGGIWVGLEGNLVRISSDKNVSFYQDESFNQDPEEKTSFYSLFEDENGVFWVGTTKSGLYNFSVDENNRVVLIKRFANKRNSEAEWIDAIAETSPNKLLMGGVNGLFEFHTDTNRLFRYTRSSGLTYNRFQNIFKDSKGFIWLGTRANGIYRISKEQLVSYGLEDKISFVRSVMLDNKGNLLMTAFLTDTELDKIGAKIERDIFQENKEPYHWRLGIYNGENFHWLVPKFQNQISDYGWGEKYLTQQSRNGEWWVVTGEGLFRYPKIAFENLDKNLPIAVYGLKNGLDSNLIYRIFEDAEENMWISTAQTNNFRLYKWERKTETLRDISALPEYEPLKNSLINALVQDKDGSIWIGANSYGILRIRNDKFQYFTSLNEKKIDSVMDLFIDREHRLWVASRNQGVFRLDNTADEFPSFKQYSTKNGLSSNRTLSLTQDKQGLIYVGTDRDFNQIHLTTDRIKVYALAKELDQREYRSAVCDKKGAVWFGTTQGLVKYVPQAENSVEPPNIFITGIRVNNQSLNIPLNGTSEIDFPNLSYGQNQIRIEFVSLANLEDNNITYQYKFADQNEWSLPTKEPFLNFANLSPNSYELQIRSVTSDEKVSPNFAVARFQILPPFYQRWWFIVLSSLGLISLIYYFIRLREEKLVEAERTRTLIATDLHDDIGSNLSKISVLSEVARMQLAQEGKPDDNLLSSIARISRESVSSMSDIVWTINPKSDDMWELIRKMRQIVEEVFVPKDVAVIFNVPKETNKIKISMESRRHIYLIYKEAINNAEKYSNCTKINVDFLIDNGEIVLILADNGVGFDLGQENYGNGLANMRSRAEKLGGSLIIESSLNQGVKILLRVPLK